MDVELLLVKGCPHADLARERLVTALAEVGSNAGITERIISTTAEAEAVRFGGSPTVLVDGHDPFPTSGSSGLTCRLYPTAAGSDGAPPVPDLVVALRRAADGQLANPLGADDDPSADLRWAAFDALLEGRPVPPDRIAAALSLPSGVIDELLTSPSAHGLIDLADGQVVGVNGLTLLPTPHRLDMGGLTFHTWCAIDVIGIPAALRSDALVTSESVDGGVVTIRLRAGEPDPQFEALMWLPGGPCTDLRADFCGAANLFADRAALDRWLADRGHPAGRAIAIEEAAELGMSWWGRTAAGGCCDAPG